MGTEFGWKQISYGVLASGIQREKAVKALIVP